MYTEGYNKPMKTISLSPKTRILSLRVSEEMLAELENLAASRNTTASGLVYQLLEVYLTTETSFGNVSELIQLAKKRLKIAQGLLEETKRTEAITNQYRELHNQLLESVGRSGKLSKA